MSSSVMTPPHTACRMNTGQARMLVVIAYSTHAEKTARSATTQQVRRAMGRIIAGLGPPAKHPQPRGYSPGRPKGAIPKKAPRFQVVYKATEKPKLLV